MDQTALNQASKGALIEKINQDQKKLSRFTLAMKRAREEGAKYMEQALVSGIALGSSFGYGYLVTKNPSMAQLGSTGIDTDMAVGGAAVVAGVVIGGDIGRMTTALGLGLLVPWARDMGASMAAPAAEG